ncbi:MAG: hypothetical protein ISR47_00085 [Rhodospirillales bacterium]|nr:hypothetical protein [Rhodospirillales bacterium]
MLSRFAILIAAFGVLASASSQTHAESLTAKLVSASDMEVSFGGAVLTPGAEVAVSGGAVMAMTMGKRRKFCIDPAAYANVGRNTTIQSQGPTGCSWETVSGSFHGYAQWRIKDEKYSFSGGPVQQATAGSGQARIGAPQGATSWNLSVSGTTVWHYTRKAQGAPVNKEETETGSATIAFVLVPDSAGTPPPQPAQPPQPAEQFYPPEGLKICKEGLAAYGISQPRETHIRHDLDGLMADLRQAVQAYKSRNPGKPLHVTVPDSKVAQLSALNWLYASGGGLNNRFNMRGSSQDFVFTREADAQSVLRYQILYHRLQKAAPRGTEAGLMQGIIRKSLRESRKLNPGDVFALALEQRDGDARSAALLAHNTLRSLARSGDAQLTGLQPDREFFTRYLATIRGGQLPSRPAKDPLAGDRAGPWYHLFGTAFFEIQARGEQVANMTGAPLGGGLNSGFVSVGTAQRVLNYIRGLVRDPSTPSMASAAANDLEQLVRKYFTSSVDDPEKYCFNVWGATMGNWLFNNLDARPGARGATQTGPSIPPNRPPMRPQVNQPWTPNDTQSGGGGWQVIN